MRIRTLFLWPRLICDLKPNGNRYGPVICVVSPNENVYSETFIRAHVERLPTRTRFLYGGELPQFADEGRPLLPRLQRGGDRLAAALTGRDPGKVHRVVTRNYPRSWRERQLRQYLRSERVDAVLAEYGPTGVAVMNACEREGIPLIVHFHGYDAYVTSVLEGGAGRRYPELFDKARAIVAVSKDMERQLLALGAPRDRLHLNPYGVDLSLFHPTEPLPDAAPHFAGVGRFVDKKAPHLTLLAFRAVAREIPSARLTLAGDGPLLDACKLLARALGIAASVEFPGAMTHAGVAALMGRTHVFVQHSVTTDTGDSEGTPVAILEAAAAGLPVVATRHGGIPDVVAHGETGFLVEEADLDSMALYMLKLARSPSLSTEMGRNGRARIRDGYSIEHHLQRLYDIILHSIERT